MENFPRRSPGRVSMGAVRSPPTPEKPMTSSPQRRRFALDVRLLLGLLLVGGSVAAVMALVGAADARIQVYAAAETLAPGDRIDADDLVERSVALDGAEDLYLRVGQIPEGGIVVAQPVAAGQLVPLSAAGSTDGLRATSIVLRLSGPVSTVVETGTEVDVWAVPSSRTSTFDDDTSPGGPVVLVSGAVVVRVLEHDTLIAGGGGASAVEVLVPRTRIARLLQSIANGDALSIVPTGLPLGSP